MQLDTDHQKIVIHVPVNMKKWGGKKVIVGPQGQDLRRLDRENRRDEKLLKALGRAYKWQKWIKIGKCNSAEDISDIENINRSYVLRILRLNRLSPNIIKAILDGNQPDGFGLCDVEKTFPLLWDDQEKQFGFRI